MPPFLPPRAEGARYSSRRTAPVTYSEFPEPVIRQQPTALPPTQRRLELTPPAVTQPVQPPAKERTAPGTWREIIARFEAEQVTERETAEVEPATDVVAPDSDVAPPAREPIAPPFGYFPRSEPDEAVPWEVEEMTTADYSPPHSIHDPEHDSWPVETADGDAQAAWGDAGDDEPIGDDDADVRAAPDEALEDIGELILDDVIGEAAWEDELEPAETAAEAPGDFPLDAFIVPPGVHHAPAGYDAEHVALLVAHRLDELAQQLRDGGLGALGSADSVDELSRVLAAIVTGYLARDV